jgi:hypothetical protein
MSDIHIHIPPGYELVARFGVIHVRPIKEPSRPTSCFSRVFEAMRRRKTLRFGSAAITESGGGAKCDSSQ